MRKQLAELREQVPGFKALILDEIYTFVGNKGKRWYVFAAYGITEFRYVVRFVALLPSVDMLSLRHFMRLLPPADHYFSDGEPMYTAVLGRQIVQEKGEMTNLVESLNAQTRQYCSMLRRRTKGFARTVDGLRRQLAHLVFSRSWLKPTRLAFLEEGFASI